MTKKKTHEEWQQDVGKAEEQMKLWKFTRELPKIQKELEQIDINAIGGHCGNFAEATQRIFGGDVWCSYEDELRSMDGQPAHCMIQIDDTFFDIRGSRDRESAMFVLRDVAESGLKEEEIDTQIELVDKWGYKEIRDEDTITTIEKIIRKHIDEVMT